MEPADGRAISMPLAWHPRLFHGTRRERNVWPLIGEGRGIYWPLPDEVVIVANLRAGQRSAESRASHRKWLASRDKQPVRRKIS